MLCYGKDYRPSFSDGKMILMESNFLQENNAENAIDNDCRIEILTAVSKGYQWSKCIFHLYLTFVIAIGG